MTALLSATALAARVSASRDLRESFKRESTALLRFFAGLLFLLRVFVAPPMVYTRPISLKASKAQT